MNPLRAACALTLAGLALALVACGGGSGGSAASSSSAEDRDAARVRLSECLRKQGIDVPDSPGQGGGAPRRINREKVEKAMNGPCKKYRDQAFGDLSEEDRQEMRDQMVKFSSCMREHGVDMPDITPGQGRPSRVRINLDTPRARRAAEACRKLLPRARGGFIGPGPGGPDEAGAAR